MRPAIFLILLVTLSAIDITSTWHLLNNVPGEEVNPFVNTQSLLGIIFSPIPNLVDLGFLACVFLAERHRDRFQELVAAKSYKASIFLFPIYYLFFLLMVATSNVLAVFGHGTPLSFLYKPFAFISDNSFIQLGLALSVTILLTLPIFAKLAGAIYGLRNLHHSSH
jgi:hypothetical protein